ncbi:MAG: periplasmic heavy metal sensor [Paracoccaceae bacterium]|uniref:periplasmic heavy metal sensor n=1 Tax=Yoonia sp. TaxID=2212373 RepID=UPI003267C1F6
MVDTTKDNKPRTAKWVKVLLGVSLASNLAIVGLVAGAFSKNPRFGQGGGVARYAMPYVIALTKEDRRSVFQAMRNGASIGQFPAREERRKLYEEMLTVIEAEPLELDKVQAILERQTQTALVAQDAAQAAWLEQISTYDAAERRAYADRVRDVLKRGPRRKGGEK